MTLSGRASERKSKVKASESWDEYTSDGAQKCDEHSLTSSTSGVALNVVAVRLVLAIDVKLDNIHLPSIQVQ